MDDLDFDPVKQDKYGFEKDPIGLNQSITIHNVTKVRIRKNLFCIVISKMIFYRNLDMDFPKIKRLWIAFL